MPALPLDEAGKYVAAAYVVFLTLIIVYVAIMAAKVQRMERDLRELAEIAEERNAAGNADPATAESGVSEITSENASRSDSLRSSEVGVEAQQGDRAPARGGRGAEHAGGN